VIKEYSFATVKTIKQFCDDRAFISGVIGPFGSGKTVGCVMKIIQRALEQAPGPDGVRRSRWGIIRNSYPSLRDTSIPTFMEWAGDFGTYMKSEYDFKMNKLKAPDGSPVEAVFHFRALDRAADIRNLLSLELSGCFFNEIKEIPKRIVDVMRGRVGRYPSKASGGCTWSGIVFDSNPCDTDHWLYKLLEIDKPRYCSTCKDAQGGIILFVEGQCPRCKDNIGLPFVSLYRQPSGRGPDAENLPNLEVGYYARLAAGMDKDFIRVYVDGEYGYVSDGKAVYQIFDEHKHVAREKLKAVTDYPLIIAFDNTGRDQAAVICQYLPIGQLRVLHEFVMTDTGTRTLVREIVKPFIVSNYPGAKLILTGDPAGVRPSDTDERNTFEEISEAFGISAFPARSNTLGARLGAVESLMKRFLGGDKFGLLVSPTCGILIKGFRGEYRMRRLQVVGQERYTDKPEKNLVSHAHDALQYAALAVEDSLVLTSEGSLDWGSGNVILTPSTWIAFT